MVPVAVPVAAEAEVRVVLAENQEDQEEAQAVVEAAVRQVQPVARAAVVVAVQVVLPGVQVDRVVAQAVEAAEVPAVQLAAQAELEAVRAMVEEEVLWVHPGVQEAAALAGLTDQAVVRGAAVPLSDPDPATVPEVFQTVRPV